MDLSKWQSVGALAIAGAVSNFIALAVWLLVARHKDPSLRQRIVAYIMSVELALVGMFMWGWAVYCMIAL
ncbi:MAG TPA: hypothetical protein VIM11_02730 [Tepidisphaeraceae bacterium]|jgi:hypothetical protein